MASWDWPACDLTTSYAAPEVVFGRKPWDGGASTTTSLPKLISDVQSLTVDFGVEVSGDTCYNLNTTMWLTQSDAAPTAADPENITSEVMVRFNDAAGLGTCCTLDEAVTLGGLTFDMFHQDAHGDDSGGTSHTWKMVIYTSRTPLTDATFDWSLVLEDMVRKGLADASYGVQGVELISEISGGAGELWLDRFNVTVQ